MSLWGDFLGMLTGRRNAEAEADELADVVCWNGNVAHYRHLYKGARFCVRGCGHENPSYQTSDEPVAVPSEGL